MKKFYLYLLLTTFCYNCFSQSKLDSLKKVLAKLPPEGRSFAGDTMRVKVLCEMGLSYDLNTDGLEHINKALSISKKTDWKKGIANSINLRGWHYLRKGFYFQSIEDLSEGLKLGIELEDNFIKAYSYRFIGGCYFEMGEDKLAVDNYNNAFEIYNTIKERSSIRPALLVLNNIGLCYARLKNYKTAIYYYKQAIPKGLVLKDSTALAWVHSNLGSSLRDGGFPTKAIEHYDKSIAYSKNKPNSNKAFTISEKAKAFLLLNRNSDALNLSKWAEKYGKETTIFEYTYILEALYQSYKASNKPVEALKVFEKLNKLQLRNEAEIRRKSIEGLKYNFENKKNLEKIEQQNRIRTWLIGGLSILFVLIGVIFRNNFVLNKKNEEISSQKLEIEIVKNELMYFNQNLEVKIKERTVELEDALNEIKEAMMKGQTIERQRVAMELHDNLGSVISGMKYRIQALDREKMSEKEKLIFDGLVSGMGDAYGSIRLLSHNLLPTELENEGFFGAIKKLVYDINLSEKLTIKTFFEDENRLLNKKVSFELYGICLEVLNNILKHSGATKAELSTRINNNDFELEIKDNGKGLENNNLNNGNGIKNIQNRLRLINGSISFRENEPSGLIILLRIQNFI